MSEDGEISYLVHIRHLRFMAQMLPDCSWRNQQNRTRDMRRVLEHEQIHFALIEIGARQLDRHAERLVMDLEITAPSRSQAEAAAQAHVEAIVELALVTLRERHARFDREAHNHPLPDNWQGVWWNRVQRELMAHGVDGVNVSIDSP